MVLFVTYQQMHLSDLDTKVTCKNLYQLLFSFNF